MTAPLTRRLPLAARVFAQRFRSTRLDARLARQLALHQLHAWGVPYDSDASDTAAVLVGELAANAVTHGRVPGRYFELRLVLMPRLLRVEVSDTRTEQRPPVSGHLVPPPPFADSGRGLVLLEALADRWTVLDRVPVGKTIRAELDLPR